MLVYTYGWFRGTPRLGWFKGTPPGSALEVSVPRGKTNKAIKSSNFLSAALPMGKQRRGSTTGDATRDRQEVAARSRRREAIENATGLLEKGKQLRRDQEENARRFQTLSLEADDEQTVSAVSASELAQVSGSFG